MPFRANVTTAAAATNAPLSTARRNILRGATTRRDRYVDDPEEEAGLLERGEYHEEETGSEREPGSPYPVCFRFLAAGEV